MLYHDNLALYSITDTNVLWMLRNTDKLSAHYEETYSTVLWLFTTFLISSVALEDEDVFKRSISA